MENSQDLPDDAFFIPSAEHLRAAEAEESEADEAEESEAEESEAEESEAEESDDNGTCGLRRSFLQMDQCR